MVSAGDVAAVHASARLMFMSQAIRPTDCFYNDSPAPEAVAGEKDACGVGFLAQLSGEASHWVLQQALRTRMHGAPRWLRW